MWLFHISNESWLRPSFRYRTSAYREPNWCAIPLNGASDLRPEFWIDWRLWILLFLIDTNFGRENENRMITIFAIQIRMRVIIILSHLYQLQYALRNSWRREKLPACNTASREKRPGLSPFLRAVTGWLYGMRHRPPFLTHALTSFSHSQSK